MLCDNLQLEGYDYDADGLGAGIRGDATRIQARRKDQRLKPLSVVAFRGSAGVLDPDRKVEGTDRTNLDMFQNLKAQSWWALRRRFAETHNAVTGKKYDPDAIISLSPGIANLTALVNELAQPQWKYSTTGKLQVDKVPDGAASPNRADAIMMLFGARRLPMKINPALFEMA